MSAWQLIGDSGTNTKKRLSTCDVKNTKQQNKITKMITKIKVCWTIIILKCFNVIYHIKQNSYRKTTASSVGKRTLNICSTEYTFVMSKTIPPMMRKNHQSPLCPSQLNQFSKKVSPKLKPTPFQFKKLKKCFVTPKMWQNYQNPKQLCSSITKKNR